MPPNLRLGQMLFYSANSDQLPLTQNHWVACASCHLEGRSDAVTWDFAQGPRDTPTNAGGLLDTGFLFRTADRTQVQDYWRTINVEQGGHFTLSNASQKALLDSLAAFVNYAIPTPVPPSTDEAHALQGSALAALRTTGREVFERTGCAGCHSGEAKTDSGGGNPSLDLTGPVVSAVTPGGVVLHDVGTCDTGAFPDVDHVDILGDPRAACAFDTPALRGLADSAPYFHDGSAATLEDVVPVMLQAVAGVGAPAPVLSGAEQRALVEYLRGL
jgi:cytochrome c peroxidase